MISNGLYTHTLIRTQQNTRFMRRIQLLLFPKPIDLLDHCLKLLTPFRGVKLLVNRLFV